MKKIRSVNLEKVIGVTSEVPRTTRPETAFAGRSNVGKSSLINALMNRKSYAHVSERPGKTQTINYYRINRSVNGEDVANGFAPDCYLVDLPGYGYAKTTLAEKEKWEGMIEGYLSTSTQLLTVFLLVDIRHAPTGQDALMYRWIIANDKRPVIVATKKDKIRRSQLTSCLNTIRTTLRCDAETPVVPFSAVTKEGLEEIWEIIAEG